MTADHSLVRLETLALVAIGGFAGSNLRFLATDLLADVPGILLVNAVGSAALAFLVYEAEYAGLVGRRSRVVFTTGFLSSLTTYSTFAVQTALAGDPLLVVGIVAGNYGLGFAGVVAGRSLARRVANGTGSAVGGGETA
ncbi:fluoride efflux transporter FluC [Natronobacterium lacisalsi]|nr:CrcB family protein [Halobiforma lacisalsi]